LRSQWDLHPEWGYLAPSPSFIRSTGRCSGDGHWRHSGRVTYRLD
jgi:hypothetical protein